MHEIGRWLFGVGLCMAISGAVLIALSRWGFKGLPGDLHYEGEQVRVYFPVVSSIALSAVLSLMLWLWQRITRN